MLLSNARNNQGFTLLETLIVIVVIGILSSLIGPSFLSLFAKNKANDSLNQVRGALQEAQREAMRTSKACTVTLNTTDKTLDAPCLVTGKRDLCDKKDNLGNCISSLNVQANETSFQFSYRGTITLADAGKIVLSTPDNSSQKKCLVISAPLGIMRTGKYTGSTASAADITAGTCTTSL